MRLASSDARHAALAGLIDYAGPFPPARRPIPDAAAEYERLLAGPHGWLVGRFACPAPALAELAAALRSPAVVPITAILSAPGEDWAGEVVEQARRAASAAAGARVRLELVEVALPPAAVGARVVADTVARVTALASLRGVYLEVSAAADLGRALDDVAAAGAGAKLRCGGLSAAQTPRPSVVAAFLVGCARRGLRAKATAGLHRPLRALDAELGVPAHGFLNLLAGAALALEGAQPDEVERAIAEEGHDTLTLSPQALRWRDRSFAPDALVRTRRDLFVGMGSCSVDEPAERLRDLRVLAA